MTDADRADHVLPPARTIELDARGTVAVWDSNVWGQATNAAASAPTRPPVVMLHGWNVDAPLNFDSAFAPLARTGRVVMFDQHGHGAGPRTRDRFALDACAHDVVCILDVLDIDRAIVVGYSLGGAVAQVLGRRTPERCAGLVLAATADRYAEGRRERLQFSGLAASAQAFKRLPPKAQNAAFLQISAAACRRYPSWVLDTVRTADPVSLLEAGAALGRFDSSEWSHQIDVPSAVVITARDTVVPPGRQRRLATRMGTERVFEIDSDHDVPIRNDARFADTLVAAVDSLTAH